MRGHKLIFRPGLRNQSRHNTKRDQIFLWPGRYRETVYTSSTRDCRALESHGLKRHPGSGRLPSDDIGTSFDKSARTAKIQHRQLLMRARNKSRISSTLQKHTRGDSLNQTKTRSASSTSLFLSSIGLEEMSSSYRSQSGCRSVSIRIQSKYEQIEAPGA
jgi:hypothetical protein